MQITELPLNALISIDLDAVDERGPGTLYSVLDLNTLQVDLPKALGPKQVVDVCNKHILLHGGWQCSLAIH